MAFTLSQKKLLEELSTNPNSFLNKIKDNKTLMNSFKDEFYQDGDGVYHLILDFAIKTNDFIYLDIFKEFYKKSDVNILQNRGHKPSAFNSVIKNINEYKGSSSVLNEIVIEILNNKEFIKNSEKNYSDWYKNETIKSIFKYLARQESLMQKNIQIIKNQSDEEKPNYNFLNILTSTINKENFSLDALKIYVDSFDIKDIQNAFQSIRFNRVEYDKSRTSYYVNPFHYNILKDNFEKINFFKEVGVDLDINKKSFKSEETNNLNAVIKKILNQGEISSELKKIIKDLPTTKQFEILENTYYVGNKSYYDNNRNVNKYGINYLMLLDKDFTIKLLSDLFDKKEQNNFFEYKNKIKIINDLLVADKDLNTLNFLNHVLDKFNIEMFSTKDEYIQQRENDLENFKKSFVPSFYKTEKWSWGIDVNNKEITETLLEISKKLDKFNLTEYAKKEVDLFNIKLLGNKDLVEFFIVDWNYSYGLDNNSKLKNIPMKIVEHLGLLNINSATNKTKENYDNFNEVLKLIFDKHNDQFLLGSNELEVINSIVSNNLNNVLSFLGIDFCKKIKDSNKRLSLQLNKNKENKEDFYNFINYLNNVEYSFSSGQMTTIIDLIDDEKLLQKVCDSNKEKFLDLFEDNYFWRFFPDNKEDFVTKNIEKYDIKLKSEVLTWLLDSQKQPSSNTGIIPFIKIYGVDKYLDEDGNNLLHIAIKKKDYMLTQFLVNEYPYLAEQSNKQKKIPVEYLFNYLDKDIKNTLVAESFQKVLLAGVSKSVKTHKKIEALFDKYDSINNLYPECKVMYNYKKMDALTKTKTSTERKFKI